ncbi:MAG: LemA family protein [Defluviitaleaceae bacterium]|nr:LemA family protein [Defluviitaleaceae bacterium]
MMMTMMVSPVLIAVVAVVVILFFYIISVYNRCVKMRNKVKSQWAQIDVQLTRRADLIPNIIESVKGAMEHERGTLLEVTEARNKFYDSRSQGAAEEIQSSDVLASSLSRLMAVAESYPALQANQNFMLLKEQLSETENKISHSRMFYNEVVLKFNNLIQVFPTNIVAGILGFREQAMFEASASERAAPRVSF